MPYFVIWSFWCAHLIKVRFTFLGWFRLQLRRQPTVDEDLEGHRSTFRKADQEAGRRRRRRARKDPAVKTKRKKNRPPLDRRKKPRNFFYNFLPPKFEFAALPSMPTVAAIMFQKIAAFRLKMPPSSNFSTRSFRLSFLFHFFKKFFFVSKTLKKNLSGCVIHWNRWKINIYFPDLYPFSFEGLDLAWRK